MSDKDINKMEVKKSHSEHWEQELDLLTPLSLQMILKCDTNTAAGTEDGLENEA